MQLFYSKSVRVLAVNQWAVLLGVDRGTKLIVTKVLENCVWHVGGVQRYSNSRLPLKPLPCAKYASPWGSYEGSSRGLHLVDPGRLDRP